SARPLPLHAAPQLPPPGAQRAVSPRPLPARHRREDVCALPARAGAPAPLLALLGGERESAPWRCGVALEPTGPLARAAEVDRAVGAQARHREALVDVGDAAGGGRLFCPGR